MIASAARFGAVQAAPLMFVIGLLLLLRSRLRRPMNGDVAPGTHFRAPA